MKRNDAAEGDLVLHRKHGLGFVLGGGIVFLDGVLPIKPKAARRTYSASAAYDVGDPIAHPKFGDGKVIEKPSPGRILVRFADDSERLLVGK